MDWIQVFTIIGVLGGFMFFMNQRMHSDIESLSRRLDGYASRIDQLYHQFNTMLKQSSDRTDRLYQMFCDLLKDRK